MVLASMTCYLVSGWSARAQEPGRTGSDEFNSGEERTGGLRLGLPEKALKAIVPCVPAKDKEIFEGATGLHVQKWSYPKCGIVLKMGSERKGGSKTIEWITVTSPSDLATLKGIHIGSTEGEVIKAYGPYRDQENSENGRRFVAGSIYDGMIFDFKDGKVVKIFLGAAAE